MELHGGVPNSQPLKLLLICEVDAALPAGIEITQFTRKPPVPVLPANAPAIAFADPAIVRVAPTAAPSSTSALPSATVPLPNPPQPVPLADAPVLDIEQRLKDKAAAVDVPPIHEKSEARVKRSNQPKTVAMVEMKSIFEANWVKENKYEKREHHMLFWYGNISCFVPA